MVTRTAVITGVLGQDGSLLAELLLSRGYRVVGVVKPGTVLPASGPLAEVSFAAPDLTDSIAVRAMLAKWQPDELYHLAAFHHASQDLSVSGALASKESMLTTNFLATKSLAFALLEAKSPCRLVYAASSQMYTPHQLTTEIDECSLRRPATFYGHTKAWSMELLAFLRCESALSASSAILFNHESPRRGAQFVSRKITRAAAHALNGGLPQLELHNIASRVDWSSASDVVEALSLMGTSGTNEDYVVASGLLHSVRDIVEIAFSYVGRDWREFITVREDRLSPALLGRPQAIQDALGWQRSVSFERMIVQMVEQDLTDTVR